jgi:DNA-binding IclR family transcriptional regulator
MSKTYASLEKGLDLLLSFDSEQPYLTTQELADRSGVPLSSTYKYLNVLIKKGLIQKDRAVRKYTLGPQVFKLGHPFLARVKVANTARPYMRQLSESTGETALLTVLNGWEAMCIEKFETRRLIKLSLDRGSTLPLYAGASSKILLAYQDEQFLEEMLHAVPMHRLTANTIVDKEQLGCELETIRRQGYAWSDEECDLGASAAAAPVFDHSGCIVAGLSVAGPSDRITAARSRLVHLVCDAATAVSRAVGRKEADSRRNRCEQDQPARSASAQE